MNVFAVVVLLILVIAAVLFYRWYIRDQMELVTSWDASSEPKVLDADKLERMNDSARFTFSVWMYHTDWKTTSEPKIIFQRRSGDSGGIEPTYSDSGPKDKETFFTMEADAKVPKIRVYVRENGDDSVSFAMCQIERIPIQRWVSVIVSVNGDIIDMYLDGKLYKHCEVQKGVKKPNKTSKVYISGGTHAFQGKLSKLEYIRSDIRPQRAWEIYVDGPRDASIFGNWLNRYMLRIQWMKDGKVDKEFKV